MEKSFIRRAVDAVLDHNLYRLVVLVMVVIRTCAFLNPVIGPFVKFTLAWSALILIKDLFTERLFMVNRFRGALYLFLIAYGVTCLVNFDQNFARNLVMWAYIISNMLVMYSYDLRKSPGTVKRELLRFNHTFMIASFIGQSPSSPSSSASPSPIRSTGSSTTTASMKGGSGGSTQTPTPPASSWSST